MPIELQAVPPIRTKNRATDLALLTDSDFSREKIDLIKRTIAVDASDDELQLFLYTAKRTGLDPLARQIYAIKRGGKMTIQTGIDGYRVIADRTGKLAGISDYTFDSEEGKYPQKATVTVRKVVGAAIAEFTATARWGEYNAGGSMWAKMPYLMLGKCAEALALRKAFPADLSDVYTAEEMAQADNQQQQEAVYAEVERQKAAYTGPATLKDVLIPPELDWSYNKGTGVLICRLRSITSRKRKNGDGEYLTIEINGQIGGKRGDMLTYFHATHRDALLASAGKIAKLETEVKGDFANIVSVLEIDGQKVKAEGEPAETKARLLASTLDFTEAELLEMYKRYCNQSWDEVLEKLQERQAIVESNTAAEADDSATFDYGFQPIGK